MGPAQTEFSAPHQSDAKGPMISQDTLVPADVIRVFSFADCNTSSAGYPDSDLPDRIANTRSAPSGTPPRGRVYPDSR